MSHRRTTTLNKHVMLATATNQTTTYSPSLWLACAFIALLILTGPGLVAQPVVGPDGFTAEEQSTIQDEILQPTRGTERYRGVVIVDTTAKNAVFGLRALYKRNPAVMQMWGRTVDWAIDHKDHATTRIWLATYSGTPIPENDNGLAAYEYLVDSMGFNPDNIHGAPQSSIDTGDFTGYDVVLQTFFYLPVRNAVNVLDQGVPFVTVCVQQAEMMGIGSGDCFSGLRDTAWIQETGHEITSPWEPGLLDLQQIVWVDASYVGGNGVALVTRDSSYYHPPVACGIGYIHDVDFGSIGTVDLNLANESYWFDVAGFDLLLAYDTSLLEFVSISQGELLDRCGWEYFEYRVGPDADCGGQPCPNGIISLVGVADLAGIPGSPSCYADSTGTLAQIDFRVSADSADECSLAEMPFVWYDCGDNILSSVSGDSLYFSVGGPDTTFPNSWGTPHHCLTDSSTMLRRVSYNTGLIQLKCAPPPPDGYGDVNLNGNGFEIADFILFSNYFVVGLDVFNVNYQGQIAASDVNLDGVPLTLQDLTYMYYYITRGPWVIPNHPPDLGDTVFFSQDTVAKTVSLSYPDSLRSVYLVFEGRLDPWGEDSLGFDGQYTRVLIGSGNWLWNDSTIFEQDSLFFYSGEGTLVAAYAAYDGYTPIPTGIVGGAGGCCQNKGNVDNDPSGELNIADLVFLVEYMFADGPEPPCGRQADIVEDWSIDIADLVFLVDYMFNGGPAAAACP